MEYNGRLHKDVIYVTFPELGRLELKEIEDNPLHTRYQTTKHGVVRYHKKAYLWTFESYPARLFRSQQVTTGGRYHVAI